MSAKLNKIAMVVVAMTMATGAWAQSSASTSGTANATVIQPIAISATQTLEFGNMVITGVAETIAVSTAGVATDSHAALRAGTQTGTIREARFNVTGEGNYTYAISLPADGVVTLSDGGSNTMAVDSFVSSPSATGQLSNAGASGAQTLKVGATLKLGAAQARGTYSGTFTVGVNYN